MRMFEVLPVFRNEGFHLHEWVECDGRAEWIVSKPGAEVRRIETRVFRRVIRGDSFPTAEAARERAMQLNGCILDSDKLIEWLGAWGGVE